MSKSNIFIIDDTEHEKGNKKCSKCWSTYPTKCTKCGGLVHAQYFDENWDGYIINFKCDKCGSTDEPD